MVQFGAANAVMGDSEPNFGMDIPVTQPDHSAIDAEKKMAKFSKTKEYKVLKDYMLSRIDFYQKYLPDGRALSDVSPENRDSMWIAANAIIGEFKSVIAAYEQAETTVKTAVK